MAEVGLTFLVLLVACSSSRMIGDPDGDTDLGGDTGTETPTDWISPDVGDGDDTAGETIEDTMAEVCHDDDSDGYYDVECGGDDCDDDDPDVHPFAEEVCLDGVDQDCDGIIDGPTTLGAAVFVAVGNENRTGFDLDAREEGFALVWSSYEEEPGDNLFFRYHDLDAGTLSDATALEFGTFLQSTAIAWSYDRWGISYSTYGDMSTENEVVAFLGVEDTGAIVTPRIIMEDDGWLPSIGSMGDTFVSTYSFYDDAGFDHSLGMVAMNGDGGIIAGPTVLAADPTAAFPASIAWTGSMIGIAWDGNTIFDTEGHFEAIRFMAVDPGSWTTGPLVYAMRADPSLIGYPQHPSMVWTGSDFGIVWTEWDSTRGASFARLDETGAQLQPPRLVVPRGLHAQIVWAGSEYGMTWSGRDEKECFFATMDNGGELTSTPVELTPALTHCEAKLAWSGSQFGVFWRTDHPLGTALYFNRIGYCD